MAATCCVCAVLAVGCSDKKPTVAVAKPVAHLEAISGEVQHRPAGSLAWGTGSKGMALVLRDAVKTGRGARATLAFVAGGKLDLDEQTLVIVEPPPAASPSAGGSGKGSSRGSAKGAAPARVRVERGTVHANAKPGVPLDIATSDGRTTRVVATSRPVKLRLRATAGGKLEIAAMEGGARVTAQGKTVSLGAKQALSVEKQGGVGAAVAMPAYPELVAPTVDGHIPAGAVTFTWKPVEGATRYHVQVAKAVDFSELVGERNVDAPVSVLAKLSPGPYVWRVSAISPTGLEGEFGFARRFVVDPGPPTTQAAPAPPPSQLLTPAAAAKLSSRRRRSEVVFTWKPLADAKRYELIVSSRPKLDTVIGRARSKKPTRTVVLAAGTYYWGVYALLGKRKRKALFSEARKLTLIYIKPARVHIPKSIDRWR